MNVSVVYKKSKYELLTKHNAKIVSPEVIRAHESHKRSLDRVFSELDHIGVKWSSYPRGEFVKSEKPLNDHLVIAVGGDGTVLDVSHSLTTEPLLGVNSDEDRSVGLLCATNGDDFATKIICILEKRVAYHKISRLYGSIDGKALTVPALNDVLICDINPAAMSRYDIILPKKAEDQKSSGVWVSTPIGSTGAIASAGGVLADLGDRQLQYRVRELYRSDKSTQVIKGGFAEEIKFLSKMRQGRVYIDGKHQRAHFKEGSVLSLDMRGPKLNIYLSDPRRRSKFGKKIFF